MSALENLQPKTIYVLDTYAVETALSGNSPFVAITCIATASITVVCGDLYGNVAANTSGSVRRSTYLGTSHPGKMINNDAKLKDNDTISAVGCAVSQTFGTSGTVVVTRNKVDITLSVTPPAFDNITTSATGDITNIIPTTTVGLGLKEGDVISFDVFGGVVTFTIQEDDLQLSAGFYIPSDTTTTKVITMLSGQTIYGRFTSVKTNALGKVLLYK